MHFNNRVWIFLFLLLTFLSFCLVGCGGGTPGGSTGGSDHVAITNTGTHYEVVLNFSGISHYDIGAEYGAKILAAVPNYALLLDSYIGEIAGTDASYLTLIGRIAQIMPQIDQTYRDEIEGMASNLSNAASDVRGDGKLSLNELYFVNLICDVGRSSQCSALAVFGARSATGSTMAARILDWYQGSLNQLAKMQAIIIYKNGEKSICSIGYLGFMGVLSGINKNKVFASILDSPSGQPYTAVGKYSYPLDLRYALENYTTSDTVANFMTTRPYAFSHLIFLADPTSGKVLENNISTGGLRQVRTDASAFRAGITAWAFPNAVACVNSFLLNGYPDYHTTILSNTSRWSSINNELTAAGSPVTLSKLENIISYAGPDGVPGNQEDGDLYNSGTQQIIIFEPNTFNLQVFFRPVGGLPNTPTFESVSVSF